MSSPAALWAASTNNGIDESSGGFVAASINSGVDEFSGGLVAASNNSGVNESSSGLSAALNDSGADESSSSPVAAHENAAITGVHSLTTRAEIRKYLVVKRERAGAALTKHRHATSRPE